LDLVETVVGTGKRRVNKVKENIGNKVGERKKERRESKNKIK